MKMITVRLIAVLILPALLALAGCSDNEPTGPAEFPTSGEVFLDAFGPNVTFQAFLGSKLDAVNLDAVTVHEGSQSLSVTVPNPGDPSGSYAGGAFTTTVARDLTGFNALTFYVKASLPITLDVVGLGNDNTGTSRFTAEVNSIAVGTDWRQVVIPIPDPARLQAERGLFYFAEGPENGTGFQLWFDEIEYQTLGTISSPVPTIPTGNIDTEQGDTLSIGNGSVRYTVNGDTLTVSAMSGYFAFASSDTSVVKVAGNSVITAAGIGTAELTATLGSIPASGSVTVTVTAPSPRPATPAPTPTVPSSDVISLFSNAYTNVPVNTWSADWDAADVSDELINGNAAKKYENLSFAGVEFTSPTIDASSLTHFHIDLWIPTAIAVGTAFKVKLVDFGPDGIFSGDDVEHELVFTQSSTPALVSQTWVSLDIPMAAFTGLTSTAHLAQLVLSGTQLPVVWIDNVYFYDAGQLTSPPIPAPLPAEPSANVISVYSDAYTDVTVDTWSADWDNADVADDAVGADDVKKYTNLTVAGIEFTSSPIDASNLTRFHIDVWTPDPTNLPAQLKVKLVDFGADGLVGGGDDVEHELTFDRSTIPSLITGNWVSIDLPLTDFTGLTTTGHLAQLIISGDPNTLFVDNIYFYSEGPTEPSTAAPTPTVPATDVVSLYSDAYTSAIVDTWSTVWDSAEVEDFVIGADSMKKYTDLLFAGIETITMPLDVSAMTHFHMDVWTPDPTDAPAVFKVKLVDLGPNGVFDGGGDDVEHEMTFDETTMATASWFSIDVPLADFTGLTTRGHLGQFIISGDPNTIFIDNIYFYDANLPTEPTVSAPTPTEPAADVISLFSDAYDDVPVDVWSTVWDGANVADYVIGTDTLKVYTNLFFAVIEARNAPIDVSAMTRLHVDLWTPDPTAAPAVFKLKLVDVGANGAFGGGDDVEHELTFDHTVMNTSSWVSIDVPLSDFVNLTTRAHVAQFILSGDPETVYVDNMYFYK